MTAEAMITVDLQNIEKVKLLAENHRRLLIAARAVVDLSKTGVTDTEFVIPIDVFYELTLAVERCDHAR